MFTFQEYSKICIAYIVNEVKHRQENVALKSEIQQNQRDSMSRSELALNETSSLYGGLNGVIFDLADLVTRASIFQQLLASWNNTSLLSDTFRFVLMKILILEMKILILFF